MTGPCNPISVLEGILRSHGHGAQITALFSHLDFIGPLCQKKGIRHHLWSCHDAGFFSN